MAAPKSIRSVEDCLPWGTLVDSADVPGGGTLQLYHHRGEYEILFGEEQLMGSWATRSEQALATLAAERLGDKARSVLIGGLGMGFTLAAALRSFAPCVSIVVAELVPEIVEWARGPLTAVVGRSLDDPRVTIDIADVHDVIAAGPARFDAILLDVDNGPDGLIQLANDRLYCEWGLREAYGALRAGGVLAIWSAYSDDAFGDRLRSVGFKVDEFVIDGDRQYAPHVIWLATKS